MIKETCLVLWLMWYVISIKRSSLFRASSRLPIYFFQFFCSAIFISLFLSLSLSFCYLNFLSLLYVFQRNHFNCFTYYYKSIRNIFRIANWLKSKVRIYMRGYIPVLFGDNAYTRFSSIPCYRSSFCKCMYLFSLSLSLSIFFFSPR